MFLALCLWVAPTPSASARTIPDPTDAPQFFTTVADKLLRSTFSFGITNIPVQSNGGFIYTPATHRLLQVAANVLDASNTNFYPTVFRPVFFRDAQGNVFIVSYQQISSVTGISDPQLTQPMEVTALPAGRSTNNVYGVPWIIGAKKGFPNFEQFTMRNDIQLTRKLQVTRDSVVGYTPSTAAYFHTNIMYVLGISNHMGFAFWNSYASNYVSPTGANINIALYDNVDMWLTNSFTTIRFASTNFVYTPAAFTNWPGSQWDNTIDPNSRHPSASAFMGGAFHFPFLPESAYEVITMSFNPTANNPQFVTNIVPRLYLFPQFHLITSNRLQAFIVDGSHVIDYVHFTGPSGGRDVSGEIVEKNYNGINTPPYRQWITNSSGAPNSASQGLLNQILVSRVGPNVAPNVEKWVAPPNMPNGVPNQPAAEAAYFNGFFAPTWVYGPKVYTNTATSLQAPYTPTRTAYQYTVWQANDPLVHYLSSNLNMQKDGETGLQVSDDPSTQPPTTFHLASEGEHYQPWGRNEELSQLINVNPNPYNAACRDPLVWSSDDWNFPATNQLKLETLGQIHRGTPWQTLFLKATNILEYTDANQANPAVGQQTWMHWTGADTNDAALMSPVRDWQLTALLASLLNTNDAAHLISLNTTNWPAALDGIVGQTNFTTDPYFDIPSQISSVAMLANSPQAITIAAALTTAKSNQPTQKFISVADILAVPELSITSPWLNLNDANFSEDRIDFDISDAAYEAIPAQLLPRLRPDSFGEMFSTNSSFVVRFTGANGFDYALQSSTNLTDWTTISTNQPTQEILNFPASTTDGFARKFYRSVLLP